MKMYFITTFKSPREPVTTNKEKVDAFNVFASLFKSLPHSHLSRHRISCQGAGEWSASHFKWRSGYRPL